MSMTDDDKVFIEIAGRIRERGKAFENITTAESFMPRMADRIEALSAENERLQLLCDLNAVPAGIIEDRGRMEERAAIVAWLRKHSTYDVYNLADQIEAGGHLK